MSSFSWLPSILFVTSLLRLSLSSDSNSDSELVFVQVIFRHGDRTPVSHLDPTDPYYAYQYPEGDGGFTLRGKELMNGYGQVLRARYADYIANIQTKNIVAQSSPIRRCMETNLAVLSGLFPPRSDQIWCEDNVDVDVANSSSSSVSSLWQPIMVTTQSESFAYMLSDYGDCPLASRILATKTSLPEYAQLWSDNQELISEMVNTSGVNFTSVGMIGSVYDTLFCERDYFGTGFQAPDWLVEMGGFEQTMARMSPFNEIAFSAYGSLPAPFLRLRAGPFLKETISNFNQVRQQVMMMQSDADSSTNRFNTYGSHDSVTSMILHALGFYQQQPKYGNGLIFELRRNTSSQDFMVNLFYANVSNGYAISALAWNDSSTFRELCGATGFDCELDSFARSLEAFIPDDIATECQLV